jgi:hypothetical protein
MTATNKSWVLVTGASSGFGEETDRRGLSDSATRPARSASNRRTIRANTITPRSCHGAARVPQRGQFVSDRIFAEYRRRIFRFAPHPQASSTRPLEGLDASEFGEVCECIFPASAAAVYVL